MADPVTLSAIGIGASVAGSGISAFGTLKGGEAQSGMYKYQAGVAQLNSQIALQNRDQAIATGQTEEKKYGLAAADRLAQIRAGSGASGIDVGTGSKAQVQDSQQVVTKIDEATIANNAARKAYGFSVESATDLAQAGAYDKAASDALEGGEIKALASLVSGVGSVASKWTQGSAGGLFGGSKSGGTDQYSYAEGDMYS